MKKFFVVCIITSFITGNAISAEIAGLKNKSVFQTRLADAAAVNFTPSDFKISADGKTDVSDALQEAIIKLKSTRDCGIVFIPDGKYLITKTIYIPAGIRLIGYGINRPLIVLGKNSPVFKQPIPSDQAVYMFWFVNSYNSLTKQVSDAGAGTFYSAFSNIDILIEDGNTNAVAFRSHYAQHSFISHTDIHIGNGMAGIQEVGNEIEDVRFFGGEYGISATKTSPGWQFVTVDTYFEGQRKAAIKTQEAGLTVIRMRVKNVPVVIDINPEKCEKLYMQDCQFDNIGSSAINISNASNANNQISIRNIDCRKTSVFTTFRQNGKQIAGTGAMYKVINFTSGVQIDNIDAEPIIKTTHDFVALTTFPEPVPTDIPTFQTTDKWINIKSLGAKGDGLSDDYPIIRDAIEKYQTIYFPDGWYRVTETIKLKPNTALIGLHPVTTQLILANNTPAFAGFGGPKALVETSVGGTNIVNGVGLNTNADNPRAVGCKWMAGADSYMNDVKFVGGHGGMMNSPKGLYNERSDRSPKGQAGDESKWDTQYWSLWITNGGGGTFKDIWTAHTVAASGLYISNTSTKGQIYMLSAEHHVRSEIRIKNVSNWKMHSLQFEEEGLESRDCQALAIESCTNLLFSNTFLYRVTRVTNPYPDGIRTMNSKNLEFLNLHNTSQMKFAFDNSLYDMNAQKEIRARELTRLFLTGNPVKESSDGSNIGKVSKLATGFEFANGICHDSKGNIYFCDSRRKRIFKWSAETNSISMVTDIPWEPLSLGCDKNDKLIVLFKYYPKTGYPYDGKPEVYKNQRDAGTSYSGWGITPFGILAYTIDPDRPDDSIQLLEKMQTNSIKNVFKVLYPVFRQRLNPLPGTVQEFFLAADNVTIIPVCSEMNRSCAMTEAFPGKPYFTIDDSEKTTVRCSVGSDGNITESKPFAELGEYGIAESPDGKIYITAGEIYSFNKLGQQTGIIKVPERPTNICFGGKDGNRLFITAGTSFYAVVVN